jgi:hypothetical protein
MTIADFGNKYGSAKRTDALLKKRWLPGATEAYIRVLFLEALNRFLGFRATFVEGGFD